MYLYSIYLVDFSVVHLTVVDDMFSFQSGKMKRTYSISYRI